MLFRGCLQALGLVMAVAAPGRAEGLELEEQAAFRAAVERVAPAVVRIEPTALSEAALGGAAEAAAASGPSSGFVVDPEGWVITTAFAVPDDVADAIVVLPSGARLAARAVGRDQARGLVLLRIEPANEPLFTAGPAPLEQRGIGQWTLAVGRAWSHTTASVAVGILSATNRAWGRAVQTDAAVSPANYGGPLIDIEGRLIGILAPLPAEQAGMTTGTELYDSGIGFAVPIEDVLRVLPRLQQGDTLRPGILGITYRSRDPFTAAATIATVRGGSPAAKAGVRPGDTVVVANGMPVSRIAQLKHVLAPLYAGDKVDLVIERKRGLAIERVNASAMLTDSLPPWRRPVLGIVPVRAANDTRPDSVEAGPADAGAAPDPRPAAKAAGRGVTVGWPWPNGPAAQAGIRQGDLIESIADLEGDAAAEPIAVDAAVDLEGVVGGSEIGRSLRLGIRRGDAALSLDLVTAAAPVDIPDEVPSAQAAVEPATIERLESPEVARPPIVVMPAGTTDEPLGVLVYCVAPSGGQPRDVAAAADRLAMAWSEAASRHGIAVILPVAEDPDRWSREDIPGIARAIDALRSRRPLDRSRIGMAGSGAGGAFAWLAASALGPAVRGVALLDSPLPRQAKIEPAEPGRSRWVLFGAEDSSRIDADRRRLEQAGYAVGTIPLPAAGPPAELLCRWVESLGVF